MGKHLRRSRINAYFYRSPIYLQAYRCLLGVVNNISVRNSQNHPAFGVTGSQSGISVYRLLVHQLSYGVFWYARIDNRHVPASLIRSTRNHQANPAIAMTKSVDRIGITDWLVT